MKKLMIVGLVVGAMAYSGCTKKNVQYADVQLHSFSMVPNYVWDEFNYKYPNSKDQKWSFVNGVYKVNFVYDDKQLDATFNPQGYYVELDSLGIADTAKVVG